MAGVSRLLPQPAPAIIMIDGDQSTQVTQGGPAGLTGGESSAAPTVNTGPSDTRGGESMAWTRASGCVCVVSARVCACASLKR